jgi:hypothetical protein
MRWSMLVVTLLWSVPVAAQISPPGLGDAKTAAWIAAGVRQDLDAVERRESMTYVGVGAVREGFGVPDQPAIVVVNEEIYDRFHEHWTYSYALSYRRQKQYSLQDDSVERRQELRFYGRFSNVLQAGALRLITTFRPELRTFYTPGFARAEEPLEFRFRVRSQFAMRLDTAGVHRLIGSAEVLSSIAKASHWGDLGYRESRFCVYYSLDRASWPVTLNVGYMNDLLGRGDKLADVHYVALDVIWENPFGKPRG